MSALFSLLVVDESGDADGEECEDNSQGSEFPIELLLLLLLVDADREATTFLQGRGNEELSNRHASRIVKDMTPFTFPLVRCRFSITILEFHSTWSVVVSAIIF